MIKPDLFFTLTKVEGRVLAKEFEGELWIKAADHDQAVKQAVEAEREACAKVCDEMAEEAAKDFEPTCYVNYYRKKAAVIRARGQE